MVISPYGYSPKFDFKKEEKGKNNPEANSLVICYDDSEGHMMHYKKA